MLKYNTHFGRWIKINEVPSMILTTNRMGNGPTPAWNYKIPIARGGGLAVLLLLKDDNGQLIEWLAYHCHKILLRHLIVATDPTIIISPLETLCR